MFSILICIRNLASLVWVCIILTLTGCTNYTPDKRIVIIEDCNLQSNTLTFKNNGAKTTEFRLKLNNGFFLTKEEMLDSIVRLSRQTGEPLEKAAWLFVCSLTINDKALTQNSWQHRPEVYINSIGFGSCDDEAAILASIWESLGLEARCWLLDGHVVPEVYISGRWQIFDPSFKCFYLGSSGQICGVEELAQHPEYIINNSISDNTDIPFASVMSNSACMVEWYSTTENNRILTDSDWKTTIEKLPSPVFSLPPESVIEFPGSYIHRSVPKMHNAQVRLSIPPFWNGLVSSPLVLEKIEGKGEIILENDSFSIGSNELDSILTLKNKYYHNFTIVTSTKPIVAYYMINTRTLQVRDRNKIELLGYGLDDIEVSCAVIDSSFSIQNSVSTAFFNGTVEDYNYYIDNDVFSFHKKAINGPHSLAQSVDGYLNQDSRLTATAKDSLKPRMIKAIYAYGLAGPDSTQKTTFFTEPTGLVLFMSLIKNSVQ